MYPLVVLALLAAHHVMQDGMLLPMPLPAVGAALTADRDRQNAITVDLGDIMANYKGEGGGGGDAGVRRILEQLKGQGFFDDAVNFDGLADRVQRQLAEVQRTQQQQRRHHQLVQQQPQPVQQQLQQQQEQEQQKQPGLFDKLAQTFQKLLQQTNADHNDHQHRQQGQDRTAAAADVASSNDGNGNGRTRKSRRRILYELSVRSHYADLLAERGHFGGFDAYEEEHHHHRHHAFADDEDDIGGSSGEGAGADDAEVDGVDAVELASRRAIGGAAASSLPADGRERVAEEGRNGRRRRTIDIKATMARLIAGGKGEVVWKEEEEESSGSSDASRDGGGEEKNKKGGGEGAERAKEPPELMAQIAADKDGSVEEEEAKEGSDSDDRNGVDDDDGDGDGGDDKKCAYYTPPQSADEAKVGVLPYWSYRLCPGREVLQFHLEPRNRRKKKRKEGDGEGGDGNGRDGDEDENEKNDEGEMAVEDLVEVHATEVHSLGRYVPRTTAAAAEGELTKEYVSLARAWGDLAVGDGEDHDDDDRPLPAVIVGDVDYYSGGAQCGANRNRASRVIAVDVDLPGQSCCPLPSSDRDGLAAAAHAATPMKLIPQQQQPGGDGVDGDGDGEGEGGPDVRILVVEEPRACRYVIKTCRECRGGKVEAAEAKGGQRQQQRRGNEGALPEEEDELITLTERELMMRADEALESEFVESDDDDDLVDGDEGDEFGDKGGGASGGTTNMEDNRGESGEMEDREGEEAAAGEGKQAESQGKARAGDDFAVKSDEPGGVDPSDVQRAFLRRGSGESASPIAPNRHHAHHATSSFPPMPTSKLRSNLDLLRDMFRHSYDSYMYNAYPAGEVRPVSCQPGTFDLVRLPALTLIDSLDTLIIMGNYTEFARSVERLRQLDLAMQDEFGRVYPNFRDPGGLPDRDGGLFGVNQNVSLFETNIRALGGLLSAHQLAVAFLGDGRVSKTDVWEGGRNKVRWGGYEPADEGGGGGDDSVVPQPCASEDGRAGSADADAASCGHGTPWDESRPGLCPCSPDPVPVLPSSLASESPCSEFDDALLHADGAGAPNVGELEGGKEALCRRRKGLNATAASGNSATAMAKPWKYDGFLLTLAHDLGLRLLPAYSTETGIPYGTVNLLLGIPPGETSVASLAGGGTLTIEMELLSRLTGDPRFGRAAKLATRALFARRSGGLDLTGKHIDVHTGRWVETLSGIGSNSDSFYEYLIKQHVLFPDDVDSGDLWTMFVVAYSGVHRENGIGDWYADVDMMGGRNRGAKYVFESLMAFWPGMQVLLGEIGPAARSANAFSLVRELLGMLPERFDFGHWRVDMGGGTSPLRPELLESIYFLYAATEAGGAATTGWQWAADFALQALDEITWTECGHATVDSVHRETTGSVAYDMLRRHKEGGDAATAATRSAVASKDRRFDLKDEMPSYFLSETIKYLYLTFDGETNVLHRDKEREWVFTTEAHPVHYVPALREDASNDDIDSGPSDFDDWGANTESEDGRLDDMKRKVLAMLTERIAAKEKETEDTPDDGSGERMKDLPAPELHELDADRNKWTPKTPRYEVETDLRTYQDALLRHKFKRSTTSGVSFAPGGIAPGSVLEYPNSIESLPVADIQPTTEWIYDEEVRRDNLSFLTFRRQGMGDGANLAMSCPHLLHPSLLWVRALNGDVVDYVDSFVTSMSDEPDGLLVDLRRTTAISSAAYYGTTGPLGIFGGNSLCDIEVSAERQEDAHQGVDDHDKEANKKIEEWNGQKLIRYHMGAPLGDFDVAVSKEEVGFYVRQVESGASIEATIIEEDAGEQDVDEHDAGESETGDQCPLEAASDSDAEEGVEETRNGEAGGDGNKKGGFVMVVTDTPSPPMPGRKAESHSLVPSESARFRRRRRGLGKQVTQGDDDKAKPPYQQRKTIVSKLNGRSFACNIELWQEPDAATQMDDKAMDHDRAILATFPCSPALFGPTKMEHLLANEGLLEVGEILAPVSGDEHGCSKRGQHSEPFDDTGGEDENENGKIQLLHRGVCKFQDKALNQVARSRGTRAVIVINSDPSLFVMAGGCDEDTMGCYDDAHNPASVLVGENDGHEMAKLLEDHAASDGFIKAAIRISPQSAPLDGTGNVRPNQVPLPLVQASGDAIQIFGPSGWGIHAVRKDDVPKNGQPTYQREQGSGGGADGSEKEMKEKSEWQLFILQHNHL